MAKNIRVIEAAAPAPVKLKRVAAYARVSLDTERLSHSLSAQVSYYSNLIQRTPGWQYAGVYADEGITGTKMDIRPEFQRMLADCEAGRIDIILTKSISRFARNTIDTLNTVRHLRELGIEIRFEKEGINSLSADGELMITLLASFAQEESRSISENVKWGTRKRFQDGIPNGHCGIYGYRWEDDHLVIQPEEAEIVRLIFANYLNGLSAESTEKQLAEMGVKSLKGRHFGNSSIRCILRNVTYTGNLLLQKEYVVDPISKKKRINRGELPQYWVEDTHEAIIPMETFQAVQDEMARRRELGVLANWSIHTTCFTGRIKCGGCGASFMRASRLNKAKHSLLGEKVVFFVCGTNKRKGGHCKSSIIREEVLMEECAKVLGLETFDEDVFISRVARIVIPRKGILQFEFTDGTSLEHSWYRNAKKDCWTPEHRSYVSEMRRINSANRSNASCFTAKVHCGACGKNFCRQAYKRANGVAGARWYCKYHSATSMGKSFGGIEEDTLKSMSAQALGMDTFDEQAFRERVDHILITGKGTATVQLKDGTAFDCTYSTQRRQTKPTGETES